MKDRIENIQAKFDSIVKEYGDKYISINKVSNALTVAPEWNEKLREAFSMEELQILIENDNTAIRKGIVRYIDTIF